MKRYQTFSVKFAIDNLLYGYEKIIDACIFLQR